MSLGLISLYSYLQVCYFTDLYLAFKKFYSMKHVSQDTFESFSKYTVWQAGPPSGFGGPRAKGSKGEASCERSELKIFATTPIILALNYHSFEMFHFLKNNLFTSN